MAEMPCMMFIYLSNGVNGLVTFQLYYVLRTVGEQLYREAKLLRRSLSTTWV